MGEKESENDNSLCVHEGQFKETKIKSNVAGGYSHNVSGVFLQIYPTD